MKLFKLLKIILVAILALIFAASLGKWVSPESQIKLVENYVYWFILANFLLLLFFIVECFRNEVDRLDVSFESFAHHKAAFILIAFCSLFQVFQHDFTFKTIQDEHAIAASAKQLHESRHYRMPEQYHSVFNRKEVLLSFVDKRPAAFPVLVSIIHDIFGYWFYTPILINVFLIPVCLSGIYFLSYRLYGKTPALLSVLLMGTLPLFGHVFVSGSLAPSNLVLILGMLIVSLFFKNNPSKSNYALMVQVFCILMQIRYESLLFFPIPLLALIFARLSKAQIISLLTHWSTIAFGFFALPRLWHHAVFTKYDSQWQSEAATFSFDYVAENLYRLSDFLFSPSFVEPNSVLLSVLGISGVVLFLFGRFAGDGKRTVLKDQWFFFCAMGGGVSCLLFLLLGYSWSITDPATVRLLTPALAFLSITSGFFLYRLSSRFSPSIERYIFCLSALVLIATVWPKIARSAYDEITGISSVYKELKIEIESTRDAESYRTFVSGNPYFFYLLDEQCTSTKAFNLKPDFIAEYMQLSNAGPIYFVLLLNFDYESKGFRPINTSPPLERYYSVGRPEVLRSGPDLMVHISKVIAVDRPNTTDLSEVDKLPPERRFRVLVP